VNGETFGAEEVAMQSNLSLVRDPFSPRSVASHNYGAKTMARPPDSQQTENSL